MTALYVEFLFDSSLDLKKSPSVKNLIFEFKGI